MRALLCFFGLHLKPDDLDDNCVYWVCTCGDRVPGRKAKRRWLP